MACYRKLAGPEVVVFAETEKEPARLRIAIAIIAQRDRNQNREVQQHEKNHCVQE